MLKASKTSWFMGLALISIISFSGEFASVTYAFVLVNEKSMLNVSMLMMAYVAGGILSTPLSIYVLDRISLFKILCAIFLLSGVVVMATCYSVNLYVTFVVSFLLGLFAALFWATLACIVSSIFAKDQLHWVNKLTHCIRNIGYITSPSLAGFANSYLNPKFALLIIGCLFWLGIPFVYMLLPVYNNTIQRPSDSRQEGEVQKNSNLVYSLFWYTRSLLQLPNMSKTILPLIVTICTTSTCNVALLHLVINILHQSKAFYGWLGSLTSLGLIIGPFLFSSLLAKRGESLGACIAAAVMGICVLMTGIFHSIIFLSVISLILGIANGLQNTLMWTFLMKIMPENQRNKIIPVYMLILQLSVIVGFLISGFINVAHTQLLLLLSGTISVLFGSLGAVLNYNCSKP